VPFEFEGRDGKFYPFRLIDTAGIKAATKLSSSVEYFSRLRALGRHQADGRCVPGAGCDRGA